MKKSFTISVLCLLGTIFAMAQKPVFQTYEFENQGIIRGMSGNGKWGVHSSYDEGVCITRLINLDTHEAKIISTDQQTEYGCDVSNDGKIVVGKKAEKAAYYNTETGTWTNFPLGSRSLQGYTYGEVYCVSDDGRFAVGELNKDDIMQRVPALWEFTESGVKSLSLSGLPTKDLTQKNQGMMKFMQISSDNKYILGCMSYSYMPSGDDMGGCFFFVYNRETATYKPIGFTETDKGNWTPKADGVIFVSDAVMSNDGHYVTGNVAMYDGDDEYDAPFTYDVHKDKFTVHSDNAVKDTYNGCIANDGTIFSCTPTSTPVREWMMSYNKYWFSFNEILKQKYNMTIKEATGNSNTGTVNLISDDGKRIVAFPDPYSSYVIDLPSPASELGDGIKLLGSYNVSPEAGATISRLANITVTFDRNIIATGGSSDVEIQDADGNKVYSSAGISADGKTLSIRFRKGNLNDGEKYFLFIPEGTVTVEEDQTQTNADILIPYFGRNNAPVAVQEIYPADGNMFSYIDYNTSPVMLSFDTDILITDTASAVMYRNEEAEPYCSLILARSDKRLALYPSTTQYLFEGSKYRIEVAAGSITDLAGNNPNEKIIINYEGNYVRQISSDDIILFSDNFDSGIGNFMQWDGDQGTPNEEMTSWQFQTGYAWSIVRDDDDVAGDMKGVSHSNYTPSTQSDDWLVIPQIYIPDMLCSVKFLSQSYKNDKKDVLKVVVWESDNVYNTLTQDVIDKMKSEGKVVYEKVQSPGATEGTLTGEFTQNTISLADFAEKNVYIAFVNQNKDQSAIFLDSIEVRHDMTYLTTLEFDDRVVNKESVAIKGSLIGNDADKAYDTATLQLKDAEGNVIDTYTATGIALAKGKNHKFAFAKPLPLTIGATNKFSVSVDLDGQKNEIKASIKDMVFEPTKRVVLEEYTGRTCVNCPLGVLAIEKLEKRYGDNFLPISIHTYDNDPMSSGLSSYTSTLGLDQLGAPSGMVNRNEGSYPTVSGTLDGETIFFFSGLDSRISKDEQKMLWADYVDEEMAKPAECGIEIQSVTYDEATMTFTANCEIKYALNATNQTVNILTVLLEDNYSNPQKNGFGSYAAPELGEWGQGGKYSDAVVTNYLHQDIARNVNGLTINGTGGYIPSTVEAGKVYNATVSIPAPSTVSSLDECKLVVMLIDANTGKIINAARSKHYKDIKNEGIDGISEISSVRTYYDKSFNIAGQRVNGNAKGIIINNGKKYIK